MAGKIKGEELNKLYHVRFDAIGQNKRNNMWKILCTDFFQKYIDRNAVLVDVAAGYCEFINNIDAKVKIAIDMNPDVKKVAAEGVNVIEASVFDMDKYLEKGSVNIFFVSNFLEHLDSKESIIRLMNLMKDILAPGGGGGRYLF